MSDATFLFADIAGFTALTEAHGDEEAARLRR
jgi:class 3 adenylate cyclase